jgi:hypothetical protein
MNKKSYRVIKAGMLESSIRSVVKYYLGELFNKLLTESGIEDYETARDIVIRELQLSDGV